MSKALITVRLSGDSAETKPGTDDAVSVREAQPEAEHPTLPLITRLDPRAEEQYRILRTRLLQNPRGLSFVVVSSPGVGDGKSVTAIHLAATMALRTEDRVLLLDADLRRPSVSRFLSVPPTPGLVDVLTGSKQLDEAVRPFERVQNLWLLPAGEREINPAELLDSSRWHKLATQLRRTYKHIVADSPPFGVVADLDLVTAVSDGVILVVRPDHTNRALCSEAIRNLGQKLIGVVLNDCEDWFFWKPYVPYYYNGDGGKTGRKDRK
jgi:capsular exopolysaccharide synthesis family protein